MRSSRMRRAEGGFTLIEVTMTAVVALIGFLSLAVIFVPISRGQEQSDFETVVVQRVIRIAEEIRGTDPSRVAKLYHGRTYEVENVEGNLPGGQVISVSVDSSNPRLLLVRMVAAWRVGGHEFEREFTSELYSPES